MLLVLYSLLELSDAQSSTKFISGELCESWDQCVFERQIEEGTSGRSIRSARPRGIMRISVDHARV